MHFVEMGTGPPVLLLHGFPETCYSWRKQIPVLAEAGFHAIAPDLRGYGKTEVPLGVEKYTGLHIVGDLIGLLDALSIRQAFVVGHDWGAVIAWLLCLFRPDKVLALGNLSVHFIPRSPAGSLVQQLRTAVGESHYICKFQEPGKMEAEIARQSPKTFLRSIFARRPSPTSEGKLTLPPWISEEDIDCYADDFERNGFTGPLNYYRALDLTWELMAPWTEGKVTTPTLFMVGDADVVYHFPGAKDYIHSGAMNVDVPKLKDIIVLEGVNHFLHEEKPELVNEHIVKFLKSFVTRASEEKPSISNLKSKI